MPEYIDKKTMIYQNFIDAGCKEECIKQYLLMYENNETRNLVTQLSIHRKSLLTILHQVQEQIDSLDYLLFQLNNQCEDK